MNEKTFRQLEIYEDTTFSNIEDYIAELDLSQKTIDETIKFIWGEYFSLIAKIQSDLLEEED